MATEVPGSGRDVRNHVPYFSTQPWTEAQVIDCGYYPVERATLTAGCEQMVGNLFLPPRKHSRPAITLMGPVAPVKEQSPLQYAALGRPRTCVRNSPISPHGLKPILTPCMTGTLVSEFFGLAPTGKSFTIMAIDIHTMIGGKIAEGYHIEDWAGAMRQLSGQ